MTNVPQALSAMQHLTALAVSGRSAARSSSNPPGTALHRIARKKKRHTERSQLQKENEKGKGRNPDPFLLQDRKLPSYDSIIFTKHIAPSPMLLGGGHR